ncbi:MAG: GNAT family N-acetyltransferase [Pseudanabaena sp. CRU_2_10]|nr:GNAT family N-acetyltransferase [Pseudanabaena sp. CRU_2_10]
MLIREFTITDTEEIVQLFYDTIHRINIRDYTQEQVDAWAPKHVDVQKWIERMQDRMTYVAEENGKIIGFAELERNGHIGCFYCHADHQNMGVGTALFNQIQLTAENLGLQKLFVEVSITAKTFFERMGFSAIATEEVELRGVKLFANVMEKRLS